MIEEWKMAMVRDWHKLRDEMDKARDADQISLAHHCEDSLARLEDKLNKALVDPRDYDP